jgi:tetratricopeptide (TPR) repeat protein
MHLRPKPLLAIMMTVALGLWIPRAWCTQAGSSGRELREAAMAATAEFNRAESEGRPDADALLRQAAALWERSLESDPADLDAHTQVAGLLSRAIGRAWQRGAAPDAAELRPIWHRVAFHRQRMMELSDGRACSPMEVAYAYQIAGDFRQAERFYKRVTDPLVLFRFYTEEKHYAEAENVFRSLPGFRARYDAATDALRRTAWAFALRLGELMLQDEDDAHARAAVYRILAQASAGLSRREVLLNSAQKAVQLNPNSPWGWRWLAEAYSQGGWYASEAAVRTHEMTLFTGESEADRRSRGQIYSKLGDLYRIPLRQPERAIRYYRSAIAEFTGLPQDWYVCEGLYMNIIYTLMQNLHDPARAREVVAEAQKAFPGFPKYEGSRVDLRQMGVDVGIDDRSNRPGDGAGAASAQL